MKKTGLLFAKLTGGFVLIVLVLSLIYGVSPLNFFKLSSKNIAVSTTYIILLYVLILSTVHYALKSEGKEGIVSLGLKGRPFDLSLILTPVGFLLLYLVALLIAQAVSIKGNTPQIFLVIMKGLVFGFLFSLVEEILFRGYIFQSILEEGSENRAIIITGIIFALLHLFRPGGLMFKAVYFIGLFLLSAVLSKSWLRNRNLWTPIFIHTTFIGAMFIFSEIMKPTTAYFNKEIFWGMDKTPLAGIAGLSIMVILYFHMGRGKKKT